MLAPGFMQGQRTEGPHIRRLELTSKHGELFCRIPVVPAVSAGISLAAAGDMALSRERVLPHRGRLRDLLGIPLQRWYGARQVHSQRVLVVDGKDTEEVAREEADGLLTTDAGAALSVTVADCLPIYLADRRTGAFGVVHSGWKGTGIVREALQVLARRFGSRPADVNAVIGPGIGACCYTVPQERAEVFAARYGSAVVAREPSGPRLDLREANLVLLREAGVADVAVVSDCTSCSPSLGSYRRQGPAAYTLMLAWIAGPGAAAGRP